MLDGWSLLVLRPETALDAHLARLLNLALDAIEYTLQDAVGKGLA